MLMIENMAIGDKKKRFWAQLCYLFKKSWSDLIKFTSFNPSQVWSIYVRKLEL